MRRIFYVICHCLSSIYVTELHACVMQSDHQASMHHINDQQRKENIPTDNIEYLAGWKTAQIDAVSLLRKFSIKIMSFIISIISRF